MHNYKESLGYRMFVGSGSVLTDTAKKAYNLNPLQIGLFDAVTGKAIAPGTSSRNAKSVIVGYGSPFENVMAWTNADVPLKSTEVRADKVYSYRKALPTRAQNQIVTIGWNTVDDETTIKAQYDSTYSLFLQVEGEAALRYFGGYPLHETFVFSTPCYKFDCGEEPASDCDLPEFNPEIVVDYFVKEINASKLGNFVKAEKIFKTTSSTTVLSTAKVKKYSLTVPDLGTVEDLALVQNQYNTEITRVGRDGINSIYELVQLSSASAPSDYTVKTLNIKDDCGVCPSGYTLVEAGYVYRVEIATSSIVGPAEDLFAGVDEVESATIISSDALLTVYEVKTSEEVDLSTVTVEVVNGEEEPVEISVATTSVLIGSTPSYCTKTVNSTIAWVAGNEYEKAVKDIEIVIGADACGTTSVALLADIVSYYAGTPNLVSGSFTDVSDSVNPGCAYKITAKILSEDLLEVGCANAQIVASEFKLLAPYNDFKWSFVEPSGEPSSSLTNIGIKLTSAYVSTKFGKCSWKIDDHVDVDVPRIIVRQGEGLDVLGKCEQAWKVTELQGIKYVSGLGSQIKKEFIQQLQFTGYIHSDDPRTREVFGYNVDFIDDNALYKVYYLGYEIVEKYGKFTNNTSDQRATLTFAFKEGVDTTQFENLIEGWLASNNPELLDNALREYNAYRA